MFSALVILMTVIVLAFVIAWILSPALRRWAETPKFRMLEREQRYNNPSKHSSDDAQE